MEHTKSHYRKITRNGFKWWGFVDGFHNFSKQVDTGKWFNIRCREDQLTNGDFEFMIDGGWTL